LRCCDRFLTRNQGVLEYRAQYSQLTFPGCDGDVLMSVSTISSGLLANDLPSLTGWKLLRGGTHCGCAERLKARNSFAAQFLIGP